MEYEDYEFLNETEEVDIKCEPFEIGDDGFKVEDDIIEDSGDLFHKVHLLQAKLADLDDKIEQKYNSLERKLLINFKLVVSKLNWIQENLKIERKITPKQTVVSPPTMTKVTVQPETISPEVEEDIVIVPTQTTPVTVAVPEKRVIPLKLRVASSPRPVVLKTRPTVAPRAPVRKVYRQSLPQTPPTVKTVSVEPKNCPSFDFVGVSEGPMKRLSEGGPVKRGPPVPLKRDIEGVPKVTTVEGGVTPKIKAEKIPNQFDPARILKSKPLIKTMNDMMLFERYLQIGTYRAEVLKNMKRLGGSSMPSETMNVMRTLLSNVVQAHYTYQGLRKGKENFSTTMTWDMIRECIQARYPTATIDEIRKIVMDMLRNAPGRIKLEEFKNVS